MSEVSPLIRLFVSSTFADFAFEREVLQRAVFPRLRALCAARGCHFQPIDLRWGVSEEASAEKQTLAICLDEVSRCQHLSPDLNFLILLGDRYGSCFLPESIPSDQVARLTSHLTPTEYERFKQAYAEDHNAVPAEFVLLGSRTTDVVRQEEESLRMALAHAAQSAGFSDQELLPFTASATHQEIQRGLLDMRCDPAAVVCAIRTLDTPLIHQHAQVEALKAAVERRLGNERIWRYSTPGQFTEPQAVEAARKRDSEPSAHLDPPLQKIFAHYDALAAQLYEFLEPCVQGALAQRQVAAQTRDPAAEANHQFAEARTSVVIGRNDALTTVATYLSGQAALPLVVTGESGVGKSTLIARAVADATRAHPSAVIVARYIGITPGTGSLAELLVGLRREIAARYGQPEPESLGELSQLVAAFAQQLATLKASAERPLFVILDALDQLSAQRQQVDWLPQTLAPHVRVVVSILSDRPEVEDLRALLPNARELRLNPLTREQGADALRRWLAAEGRRLTPEQEAAVLDGFAPAATTPRSGTPLYLRLALEQARTWRAFDRVNALPPTVPALIQAYFDALEEPGRHGRELVAYALGDVAAAKHGLAEDELLDLLPRSEAVREGLHRLSPNSPPLEAQHPLPAVLWARLATDLERYLTEREADGSRLVTFYHRQVREAAERRYLTGPQQVARHADLAAYFGGLLYQQGEGSAAVWNRRKVAELAYQYAGAGPEGRLALGTSLSDGRYLVGKLTTEGVAGALDDLALEPDDQDIITIGLAIRAGAVVLAQEPLELLNQITGRVGPLARLHDLPERTTPWLRLWSRSLDGDPALLRILQGHSSDVTDCALSADGRVALSSSKDRTLRLWDTSTGQCVRIFEGHTGAVASCALSTDGHLALSASDDRTLRLWDTGTGQCVRIFEGHTDKVSDCALAGDGRLALSTSGDRTLRLWDTYSGRCLGTLSGDISTKACCALSADGHFALSADSNKKLQVWDLASGQPLHSQTFLGMDPTGCALSADGRLALCTWSDAVTLIRSRKDGAYLWNWSSGQPKQLLEQYSNRLTGCALSADGHVALSASADQTLRLMDTVSGALLRVFKGHTSGVTGCALSADGRLALSASGDRTVRLWTTGEAYQSPNTLQTAPAYTGSVTRCALSADACVALTGDYTLRLWDATTGQMLRTLQVASEGVKGCALNADGRLALASFEDRRKTVRLISSTLRLWDTTTGQPLRDFKGYTFGIRGCALSTDGRVALAVFQDYTWRHVFSTTHGDIMHLLDTASGKLIRSIEVPSDVVMCCALSADGRMILTGAVRNKLQLWDTSTGQCVHIFEGHRGMIRSCALGADGNLALSASQDQTLRLWDTATGQCLQVLKGHTAWVGGCALSADGRLALSASWDQTLRLWDTARGQEIARWTHATGLQACSLSPDGHLAIAGDGSGSVHFLDIVMTHPASGGGT